MTLALLLTAATGAWADDYTITLPTVSNGSVVAKVSDVSVTSAAADATVSLVATPDAGYKLKTISATTYNISETFSSGANTRTGTYFRVSGSNYAYGWRIGSGDNYTLTISSLSNQNLSQVVLTVGTAPNVSQRNISHLQADHGTLSATGTTQGNTITITGINSPTVTVSAPGSNNGASMWSITQAKVDGIGAITLTDTSDDNVKTFTMPLGNVTVLAEFEEPTVEVTINEAKSEASFEMPQYDVTATYTIKRDISVDVTATMGDGTDGVRYRVKKSEQVPGKYEPAEMNMMQVLALVAVNDGIEQKALTLNQDYYCRIYKLDEQTQQPAGDGVLLADFDFAPGLYALKAFAEKGSNYDGETALSNTFVLFEGYQVEVAAKEFITYYKDEPLYVEDEDAVLYTISSVNGDQAVLSEKSDAMPSNTPMLVYNKSNETKTFLLIPCAEPDMDITVAPEFVGTLEATTIAASTDDQTNYALNGKQFVWVKDAIEVGPNKAWLSISTGVPSARITIVFDDATKIATTNLTNITNGDWYDLNGRKLNGMPTKKGIYIMNGKKVVVK